MDFSVAGSESWDSTPSQEIFIQSYFKKRESQHPSSENKISKRRKRNVLNFDTVTSNSIVGDHKKKISKIEASFKHVGDKATTNVAIRSLCTNRVDHTDESNTFNLVQNNIKTDLHPDLKKSSLKSNNKTVSYKLDLKRSKKLEERISDTDESSSYDCIQDEVNVAEIKIALKTKKNKRPVNVDMLKDSNKGVVSSQVNCTPVKQTVTKIKTRANKELQKKKDLNSKNRSSIKLIPADVSDESDEELIRNELQNTPIFKKLQRLMKQAPHLDPNFDCSKDIPLLEDFSDESMSEDQDDNSIISDSSSVEDNAEDSPLRTNKYKPRLSNNQHSVNNASSTSVSLSSKASSDKSTSKEPDNSIICNSSSETDNDGSSVEDDSNASLQVSKDKSNTTKNQKTLINASHRENMSDPSVNRNTLKSKVSSTLRSKAQEKLASAKFRYLNEKLYTETGRDAFKFFQENTDEFEDYHLGYSLQVSKWPLNPVNEIITQLQQMKKNIVIADLGCGDAKIAQVLTSRVVHSFDLVAINEFVTACDFSKVPLPNQSVDVAVFCLSLMGVNLKDYLCEAHRILKLGGSLKIAEVVSRIEDLDFFIESITTLGFTLERKNTKHKLFVFLNFKKEKRNQKKRKIPTITLKPCLYKKR